MPKPKPITGGQLTLADETKVMLTIETCARCKRPYVQTDAPGGLIRSSWLRLDPDGVTFEAHRCQPPGTTIPAGWPHDIGAPRPTDEET